MSYLDRLKASRFENPQPSQLQKVQEDHSYSFCSTQTGQSGKNDSHLGSESSPPKELQKVQKAEAHFQKSDILPTAKAAKSPSYSFCSTDSGLFPKNDVSESLPATLVKAALRVCDAHGDSEEQRQQMLADLASYPADRHAWLTDYLNGEADRLETPRPDVMDDRRTCSVCTNFRAGRCLAAWRGELPATSRQYHPRPNMLRRCEGYSPDASDPDRRHGRERWPRLMTSDTNTPNTGAIE